MLQNRVDPFGNLVKTAARGSWMGNRGLLHNDNQEILRPFKLKAWITCRLEFKGWKRKVMAPERYTELFFLDEATSFAAGHRPCFECRRNDADRFKSFWLKGNPEYNFNEKTSIKEIDEVLHKERIDLNKSKKTFEGDINNLPNGTFILHNSQAFLLVDRLMLLWSPFGYGDTMAVPGLGTVTVLTPKSVVNTFRAGYLPQMAVTLNQR